MNKARIKTLIINITLCTIIVCTGLIVSSSGNAVEISSKKAYSAIYNGDREKSCVSVMVNVYENAEIVSKMVDVFDSYGAKATFFVGGCWADDNMEILQKIVEHGHELGNHGYFHKEQGKLGYDANLQEIKSNHQLVRSLTGVEMNLFAPPSGDYSVDTLKSACSLGYTTIMWSKDTIDWRDSDEKLIYKRATQNVENGDFILMHPKSHTLAVLPKILEYFNDIGKQVVKVSDLL